MCKDKNREIIISEQWKEIKKWCTGDCKKCPFTVSVVWEWENLHNGSIEISEQLNKDFDTMLKE